MKKSKKSPFKISTLSNSSWITNFWYFAESLYLTESLFDEEQNFFGLISWENLNNNIGFKKENLTFLNQPDPTINSALLASQSDIKPLAYLNDYVYNVFVDEDKIYVAWIKSDKIHGYTKVYDHEFNEVSEPVEQYLILGKFNHNLLFLSVSSREVFVYKNQQMTKSIYQDVIKIINHDQGDFLLTSKHQIFWKQPKEKLRLIYESNDDLTMALLNDEVLIISEKSRQTTFSLSLTNLEAKTFITNEYFFRLEVINHKILIGKPLFLNQKYEDYTLPLKAIW